MVTVEAAMALCALVAVLAMVLAGVSAVLDQIRCTDAAREAARLVARGEQDRAGEAVARIAPSGATFTVATTDDTATVVVSAAPVGGLLPGIRVHAEAYAVREPAPADPDPPPNPAPVSGSGSASAGQPGAHAAADSGRTTRLGSGLPIGPAARPGSGPPPGPGPRVPRGHAAPAAWPDKVTSPTEGIRPGPGAPAMVGGPTEAPSRSAEGAGR